MIGEQPTGQTGTQDIAQAIREPATAVEAASDAGDKFDAVVDKLDDISSAMDIIADKEKQPT
jgi:hypothetical protein